MQFAIICVDRHDAGTTRQDTRSAHLDYLKTIGERLLLAGPTLDALGTPNGSLIIIEADDEAGAKRFAENDPYAQAGLFEEVRVTALRAALGRWPESDDGKPRG